MILSEFCMKVEYFRTICCNQRKKFLTVKRNTGIKRINTNRFLLFKVWNFNNTPRSAASQRGFAHWRAIVCRHMVVQKTCRSNAVLGAESWH